MTFVTSDGVKQEAEIYVIDIIDSDEMFPNVGPTKKAMVMGWLALRRQGDETRSWDEWVRTIKNPPDIDVEDDDPKEVRDALSPS